MDEKNNKAKRVECPHNCFECELVRCTNFYRKGEADLEGGEIYVLQKSIEKKIFPRNVGDVIYTICQLWSSLDNTFPSSEIFYQCIRDLRASAYLLVSGHYRSSIQLLRPIVENVVTGIYWDSKYLLANYEERELVKQEFLTYRNDDKFEVQKDEWKDVFPKRAESEQKRKLGYDFCLSWLERQKGTMINGEAKNEISVTISELNKYLHSSGLKYMEIGKKGSPSCACFVGYQESEFKNCMRLYQDVAALMLEVLYKYVQAFFPEKTKSSVELIQRMIGNIETIELVENEMSAKLVFSQQLRVFLSKNEFSVTP